MALAKKADVVLLCLGLDEIKESEGLDRADMKLAENQIELLGAVAGGQPQHGGGAERQVHRWKRRGSSTAGRWSTARWADRPVQAPWWMC